jgi:uncharacterized membrane protein YuzA (DUF378 family)
MEWMPKPLDFLALGLTTIGALNWGLVSLFKLDLVATLAGVGFGQVTPLSQVIYGLVGLAGLYLLASLPRTLGRPAVATTPSA